MTAQLTSKPSIAFVAERPLQIINAISICEQLKLAGDVDILVANSFADAPGITERLSQAFGLYNFHSFPDYHSAISHHLTKSYDELFLHWDVGFGTSKKLRDIKRRHPKLRISVYEEGVGTYRDDIYHGLKREIFRALGLPINVGGSKYTDRIFVYNPEEYFRSTPKWPRQVISIDKTVEEFIRQNYWKFSSVFDPDHFLAGVSPALAEDCVIYLSGWDFEEHDADMHFSESSFNILKLHPHCRLEVTPTAAAVAPNSLPAELLIYVAAERFANVKVIHKGSSTSRYVTSENVTFVDETGE